MADFASQPGDRYIRAASLWGFADFVTGLGGDPAALAARVGLDKRALTDVDEVISWRRLSLLFELAAEELGKPSLGLEFALTIPSHFPNVGPVMLMTACVGSGEEWLRLAIQYWRFHTNAYSFQFFANNDGPEAVVRLHLEALGFARRQVIEAHMGNATRMARVVIGNGEANPTLVRFQHPRPPDISAHEALFRCPMEFGAPDYEMHFEKKYLALPTSGNLKILKSLVTWYIRYRIRHLPIYDQTMKATTALAIKSMLGTGNCSLEFIAHSLGLSPKKLQRLLAYENTSFSTILEEVREETGRRLLTESDAPIAHIAGLLEYASTAPFGLAFRRWTGLSPRAYRYRSRGLAADDTDQDED